MVQIRQSGLILKFDSFFGGSRSDPMKINFFANQLNSNRPLNTVFVKLNNFFKVKFDLKHLIQDFVLKGFPLLQSPAKISLMMPQFLKG